MTTMTITSSTDISEYYYGVGFFKKKFYEKDTCAAWCHVSSTPTFCTGNREAEKCPLPLLLIPRSWDTQGS